MSDDVEFKLLKEVNYIDYEDDYMMIPFDEPQLIIKKELPYGILRVFLHKLAIARCDKNTDTMIDIYEYNNREAIDIINQCIVNNDIHPVISFNFKLYDLSITNMINDLYIEYIYNDGSMEMPTIYSLNIYDFISKSFNKMILDDSIFNQNVVGEKNLLFLISFTNNTVEQINILNSSECEHILSIPSIINSVKIDAYDEMIHPEYIEERYNLTDEEILSFEDDEYTFNDSEPEEDYDELDIKNDD